MQGRMDVKHGVVEVGVRIRARARAQQLLAPVAAQKRDMLHQVRQALLVLPLVHAACAHVVRVHAIKLCSSLAPKVVMHLSR